jgi:hypothetical protein
VFTQNKSGLCDAASAAFLGVFTQGIWHRRCGFDGTGPGLVRGLVWSSQGPCLVYGGARSLGSYISFGRGLARGLLSHLQRARTWHRPLYLRRESGTGDAASASPRDRPESGAVRAGAPPPARHSATGHLEHPKGACWHAVDIDRNALGGDFITDDKNSKQELVFFCRCWH